MRESSSFMSCPACRECLEERVVMGPAPDVAQLHVQSAQRCDGLLPVRLKLSQEPTSGFGDDFTEPRQLRIPYARLGPESQCSVTLLECPRVPDPCIDEVRFHVEHRPVHPAAPAVPAFFDELVHAGLNDLDREGVRELGKRLRRPATDPRTGAVPRELKAEGLCLPRRAHDASNDSQMILSALY